MIEDHPVHDVRWVPHDQVEANTWNPNKVGMRELQLLYTSVKADGYTQPVVTIYDAERDKYIVVDGFHRWLLMRRHKDIYDSTGGRLPIVVLDKNPAEQMASTIRHNRARGKHTITGMSSLVFGMLDEGKSEAEICDELGMEAEELLRLKYMSGFAKLFESVDYRRVWITRRQLQLQKAHDEEEARKLAEADADALV